MCRGYIDSEYKVPADVHYVYGHPVHISTLYMYVLRLPTHYLLPTP